MTRSRSTSDRLVGLLEVNARELLRYLERRVGPDDAPDALSETMTAAWRRGDTAPGSDEDARLWLFGIARNVVFNTTRGQRRRSLLTERLRATFHRESSADVVAAEILDVRAAVSMLEPDLAELVRLVHWEGFTIADAAKIIGVPESTARSRYARAKKELSVILQPRPHSIT